MNTALHAAEILSTWQFAEKTDLRAALARASYAARKVRSISALDQEREEMLQSVTRELELLDRTGGLPAFSTGNGAVVLLEHLCALGTRPAPVMSECEESTGFFVPLSA